MIEFRLKVDQLSVIVDKVGQANLGVSASPAFGIWGGCLLAPL